jgi:hypothetical protein
MMMGSADPTGLKSVGLNIMETTNKCKIPECNFFVCQFQDVSLLS